MTQTIDKFPHIQTVALHIAYDNGMINVTCSVEQFLEAVNDVIGADGVDLADLQKVEAWLATLDDEDLETLACGDQFDQTEIACTFSDPELLAIFDDISEVNV